MRGPRGVWPLMVACVVATLLCSTAAQWTQNTWSLGYGTYQLNILANYAANQPGARGSGYSAVTLDRNNNHVLRLFGGQGANFYEGQGQLNDMWQWNYNTSQWLWQGNPNTTWLNSVANYGIAPGVFSASAWPGGRSEGAAWSDPDGNMWIYGGWGMGYSSADEFRLSEIWKWSERLQQWTYISGSPTCCDYINFANDATATPGGRQLFASTSDNQGNLYIYGGYGIIPSGFYLATEISNDVWMYNISTLQWYNLSNPVLLDSWAAPIGVESPLAVPPPLSLASLVYVDNYLYLFGGFDENDMPHNCFWRFNLATNLWTWLGGNPNDTYGVYYPSAKRDMADISIAFEVADNYLVGSVPTGTPVADPVAAPVSSPVSSPVPSPAPAPQPVSPPVAAPVAAPVAEPAPSPAPAPAPAPAPVPSPAPEPVTPPTVAPVAAPVHAPIAEPVAAPVEPPTPIPAPAPMPAPMSPPAPQLVPVTPPTPVPAPVTPPAPAPAPVSPPVAITLPASGNPMPGARMGASLVYVPATGLIYMAFGLGYDAYNQTGCMNDLWSYNITANTWTFIAGNISTPATPIYTTPGNPMGRLLPHTWVDPYSNIWFAQGYNIPDWLPSTTEQDYFNDIWSWSTLAPAQAPPNGVVPVAPVPAAPWMPSPSPLPSFTPVDPSQCTNAPQPPGSGWFCGAQSTWVYPTDYTVSGTWTVSGYENIWIYGTLIVPNTATLIIEYGSDIATSGQLNFFGTLNLQFQYQDAVMLASIESANDYEIPLIEHQEIPPAFLREAMSRRSTSPVKPFIRTFGKENKRNINIDINIGNGIIVGGPSCSSFDWYVYDVQVSGSTYNVIAYVQDFTLSCASRWWIVLIVIVAIAVLFGFAALVARYVFRNKALVAEPTAQDADADVAPQPTETGRTRAKHVPEGVVGIDISEIDIEASGMDDPAPYHGGAQIEQSEVPGSENDEYSDDHETGESEEEGEE